MKGLITESLTLNKRVESMQNVYYDFSLFSDEDIYLFKSGNHFQLYKQMGAHLTQREDHPGVTFAIWAPSARMVSVMGDFNGWNKDSHQLKLRKDGSGIWEGFTPDVKKGALYKFFIRSKFHNYQVEKKDPFSFLGETPPKTASVVWDLHYDWQDELWMRTRFLKNSLHSPISIYEVHLGSWRRLIEEGNRFMTYREIAPYLIDYVTKMGFTHIELMPVMEHPFYGSWGYQSLGYFAPTCRYGLPEDLMFLVDCLHQNGIGVILDWVPSHFPSDEHGLVYFDGTHLFEHADHQKGYHPDWKSYIFNCGRWEVKEFLISSALFWLDLYHADGLRVDAVASMLYLDYSRKEGEWSPNVHGGRENIESIAFIKEMNQTIYKFFPDVQMIAEESTAWPNVSRPTYTGGLGFGMKWNMGWMHDTLEFFKKDPSHRKYHLNNLTFSMLYAFSENFVLSLSHDEVVHGKASLLSKMPGDDWQKFANLRLLLGYMFGHSGKKLLFMGGEFGQWSEWNHEQSLDWHLLQYDHHQGIQNWVKDLNHVYQKELALHEQDFGPDGLEWVEGNDWENTVISFLRKSPLKDELILVVCNFTPVPRYHYKIGVPRDGSWRELLNSDEKIYGGSGLGNQGGVKADSSACHGKKYSLSLTLPPLGVFFLKNEQNLIVEGSFINDV